LFELVRDDQSNKTLYLEASNEGDFNAGRDQGQWKHGLRSVKRSRRWKAPRVSSRAVTFASDRWRQPFKQTVLLRMHSEPAS